jgi:hypothetical protein
VCGSNVEVAHAVGLSWCASGSHRVTAVACTSPGGILHASCLAFLERRREAYAAHAGAAAIDQNAEQQAMDDREGVAMEPIVDDKFGDDTEWMDVDLPGDSAVSLREKTLLHNMRQQLADVKMQHCSSTCCERVFDIGIRDGTDECQRVGCQADKHQDGKLWSDANNVNPRTLQFMLHTPGSHLSTADQPDCLKGLTDIQEMLIAGIKPIMHVRYTRGRQLCYDL